MPFQITTGRRSAVSAPGARHSTGAAGKLTGIALMPESPLSMSDSRDSSQEACIRSTGSELLIASGNVQYVLARSELVE